MHTNVQFGDLTIAVTGDDLLEVVQQVEQIRQLNTAYEQEGLSAEEVSPFYRKTGNFEYFGFRRKSDGAEVNFGNSGGGNYFAYRKGYVNDSNPQARYKGFRKPDFSNAPDAPEAPRAQHMSAAPPPTPAYT